MVMNRRSVLCVTTTKPTAVLTPGAGGGSLALVDPQTGSIGSSLRAAGDMTGKVPIGTQSLSVFPCHAFGSNSNSGGGGRGTTLAMAYGTTQKSKEDSYAMLLSLRSSPSVPPILHWKSRLPEGQLTAGISISPCGHYIVGGGNSGTLYVWMALGGKLIRTVKAHYRAISVLTWTLCGKYLATGGADGMVHVFSLMDLVAYQAENLATSPLLQPIRTWPNHHLPVNALVALHGGGRLASAGQDGQVLILEISSETVLATVQLPMGITALVSGGGPSNSILYAGSDDGTISIVSLDEYAIYKMTQQQGVVAVVASSKLFATQANQVFGHTAAAAAVASFLGDANGAGSDNNSKGNETTALLTAAKEVYRTELRGHERSITSLCAYCLEENGEWMLCSGDESGMIRIWDLESKSCVRIVRPWQHGNPDTTTKTGAGASLADLHPVTSIQLVTLCEDDTCSQPQAAMGGAAAAAAAGGGGDATSHIFGSNFNHSNSNSNKSSIVSLITPLQKFMEPMNRVVSVPFLSSPNPHTLSFWSSNNNNNNNNHTAFRDCQRRCDQWVRQRLNKRQRYDLQDESDRRAMEDSKNKKELSHQQQGDDPTNQTTADSSRTENHTENQDDNGNAQERIEALERELAQARETIQRWQTVNNKLMARLEGSNA